ncbi:hypothetical protein CPB83DRAFT_863339 [Crepidotus variabilis]|uniref:Uncharacterized protein n=1 Tax=Crepidotus variabilis TaxID=179855 RepID=A0A9P6JJB7_9AGAR|nr:hypothetical protein CPB83DRAFT_863339 [Crepidotus variabilis]
MCGRLAFGVDFDAKPHQGDGAINISVNLAGCPGYYNYFVGSLSRKKKRLMSVVSMPSNL